MRVLPVELFQRGGKGGSNRVAEGVPTSKKSTHMGGGGVPTGSRGGFARRVGVLLGRLFQHGGREGSNRVAERVPTGKKSFSNRGGFVRGVGVPSKETMTMEEKKIEPNNSEGTVDRTGPKS